MKKPTNVDSLIIYPFALLALIVACVAIFGCAPSASAAQVRRVCKVQQVVQHAPVQLAVAAPVYYAIGQQVRQEAVATHQLRHSEEYIELQQLRAWKAGAEFAALQAGSRPPLQTDTGHPSQPEEGVIPPEPPAEDPPAAPVSDFAGRYPTLAAKCSRCHTGDDPKGGIWIDGTASLEGPDAAPKRDAIVRATHNGHMPPNKQLTDQEFGAVLSELYAE